LETEVLATEPYQDFLFAMNSPVTMELYSTRLRYFLGKISLTNASIEELCRIIVEKGKQDPNWIIDNIVAFLMEYRSRFLIGGKSVAQLFEIMSRE
jgi:hypothetical protein